MGEMKGSRKSTNDNSEKVLLSDVQSTVAQGPVKMKRIVLRFFLQKKEKRKEEHCCPTVNSRKDLPSTVDQYYQKMDGQDEKHSATVVTEEVRE